MREEVSSTFNERREYKFRDEGERLRNGVHTGSIIDTEVYIQGKEKYRLLCQKVHNENDKIPKIMKTKL